jgi:hypothetical protein
MSAQLSCHGCIPRLTYRRRWIYGISWRNLVNQTLENDAHHREAVTLLERSHTHSLVGLDATIRHFRHAAATDEPRSAYQVKY